MTSTTNTGLLHYTLRTAQHEATDRLPMIKKFVTNAKQNEYRKLTEFAITLDRRMRMEWCDEETEQYTAKKTEDVALWKSYAGYINSFSTQNHGEAKYICLWLSFAMSALEGALQGNLTDTSSENACNLAITKAAWFGKSHGGCVMLSHSLCWIELCKIYAREKGKRCKFCFFGGLLFFGFCKDIGNVSDIVMVLYW